MTKTIFTLGLAFILAAHAFAQDKKEESAPKGGGEELKDLKRPGDIGDAEVDGFVNQSFDLYDGTLATDKNLKALETDVEKIEKEGTKIKSDADVAKRLYAIQGEIRKRDDKVKELDNKAADMLKHAKEIKPIGKVPKATKNVNAATKALDRTKEMTPAQVKKTEELSERIKKMTQD